ncbi:MAG TPA: site-2 protease family protein [Candidatus Paceibacterota bacterium]|nr:site-2 protease family protein [Candidatus Paceibacterota bacterium]
MFFFSLIVLIVSVILHEVAHGYMANYLGDPTAKLSGRLTLNPISHIDPIGSILLPGLLLLQQSVTHVPLLIGYAKPVPINPHYLTGKYDEALTAFAGPGTNIVIALIFGLAIRFMGGPETPLQDAFVTICYLNMVLALFNLIPIPPLDGSRVLASILPGPIGRWYDDFRNGFERLGIISSTLIIMLIFYYVLAGPFSVLLSALFTLLTGVSI